MSETFRKNKEDFVCVNCSTQVVGNGFTDHCPKCLYSLHVDINPGDRAALETCGGIMEPISISPSRNGFTIFYKCLTCGYEYSNKSAQDDDVTSFIEKLGSAESISKRLPPV